jgi:hypothetical protein
VLRAILGTGALFGLIGLLSLGIGLIVKRTAITIPLLIALVIVPAMLAIDENDARKVQGWTPFAASRSSTPSTVAATTPHPGPALPSPPPTHSPYWPSAPPRREGVMCEHAIEDEQRLAARSRCVPMHRARTLATPNGTTEQPHRMTG